MGQVERRLAHASSLEVKIQTLQAETILKAIAPELESLPTRRVKAAISCLEDGLILTLEAEDLVALRAGLNTFLRWISAIERCLSLTERESGI
ncbi:MAG: KEOPS complex subunit Pcc1 [Nitrososphaerota archaeon]